MSVAGAVKLEVKYQGQSLKFDLTDSEYRLGRDETWATIQIPSTDLWNVVSNRQAVLRREGETYRIFDGAFESAAVVSSGSSNGLFANRKRVDLQAGYRIDGQNDRLTIGQDPRNCVVLAFASSETQLVKGKNARLRIDLQQELATSGSLSIGRDASCQVRLDNPLVSSVHATISRTGADTYQLEDNNSTNGTLVNNSAIDSTHRLNNGDSVQIGELVFTYRDAILEEVFSGSDSLRIEARNILCFAAERKTLPQKLGFAPPARGRQLVNCPKLDIEPGITSFIGPSGAGKSTSMKSVLGLLPRSQGVVRVNNRPMPGRYNLAQASIGYVPQTDILDSALTVRESLTYTARLRLPPDTTLTEIRERIRAIALPSVDLGDSEEKYIRSLSGGEKKRVGIAAALLTDPQGIFLDEPTSALDPGLEKEVFRVLRELAQTLGKTIVIVTHSPFIAEHSDRIALIGRGGNLQIFDTPVAVKAKYEVDDIEDIYDKLR